MPKKTQETPWEKRLRQSLKDEHGLGWSLKNRRGKAQLIRRLEDFEQSVVLDIEWAPANRTAILNSVSGIRTRLEEHPELTVKEARDGYRASTAHHLESDAKGASGGWITIRNGFLNAHSGLRDNTRADLKRIVDRVVVVMEETKPKPQTGLAVMKAYADRHFPEMTAGGVGRKRNLDGVSRFLKFGVERYGVARRFLPPAAERVRELIGASTVTTQKNLTVPIKADQFTQLLDAALEANREDLWLAIGLVGYMGLRPSELATLTVNEAGKAYVGAIKRNANTMNKVIPPRRVQPIEIEGRNGEGQRMLMLFQSGAVKLPKALRNQIAMVQQKNKYQDVGATFKQYLDRFEGWQRLQQQQPELSPYSLRHGFAWRASGCDGQIKVRNVAALMGHSKAVHDRHYGAWTDERDIEAEIERYNATVR